MLRRSDKYKTYHDVCLEPYQFSCWNSDNPNRDYLHELATEILNNNEHLFHISLKQCIFVAQGIKEDVVMDNTNNCKHYMTVGLFRTARPKWAENAIKVKEIGNHIFFDLP